MAKRRPYIPLKASPYWPKGMPGDNYPQAAFLAVPYREVLFGGAAGPGKTMGLFMAALQYVDIEDYAAVLFRRTYRQLALPGQLLDIAKRRLRDTDAKWNETEARYDFPSGARIIFGHLDSDRDLEDALGPTYQFIGFDELTTFPEHHYLELFARLRRPPTGPLSTVPLRVRSASNPGSKGHRWVRQRFMVERDPDRLFIAANLAANPGIERESYEASLAELPPHRRRQMLEGDWDSKPTGGIFDRDWFEVIDEAPRDLRPVRYWDTAATRPTEENPDPDFTAGAKLAEDPATGDLIWLDLRRLRDTAGRVEDRVRRTAQEDGRDVPIIFEQEPGASGKHMVKVWQDLLPEYRVEGRPSQGSKPTRAGPVAARAETGRVKLLSGAWNTAALDELEDFTGEPGGHDDIVDSLSGAYAGLGTTKRRRKVRVGGD